MVHKRIIKFNQTEWIAVAIQKVLNTTQQVLIPVCAKVATLLF